MKSHLITTWIFMAFIMFVTLNNHSGYHFPFSISSEFHDFHHSR
jgi:sterol desaturase/sphingolipid hydroxylase (fatty acid hydroxylase superfamily)